MHLRWCHVALSYATYSRAGPPSLERSSADATKQRRVRAMQSRCLLSSFRLNEVINFKPRVLAWLAYVAKQAKFPDRKHHLMGEGALEIMGLHSER